MKMESENVKDLEDRTVAEGTRTSIQPKLPRTHPAKSVPTWYERCAFLPHHAHAAHRIIPFHSTFLSLFLLLCHHRRLLISTVGFLQQSHQRNPERRSRCCRRPPTVATLSGSCDARRCLSAANAAAKFIPEPDETGLTQSGSGL